MVRSQPEGSWTLEHLEENHGNPYFEAKKSWMKRVLILSMSIDHHRKNILHQKQLPASHRPLTCLPNMDSKPAFASHHPQTKKDVPLHPCTRCFLDVPPVSAPIHSGPTCERRGPPAATTPRCPPRPPRRAQPKRIPTHAQPHKARGWLTWNIMIITSPVGMGRSLRPSGSRTSIVLPRARGRSGRLGRRPPSWGTRPYPPSPEQRVPGL